MDDSSNLTSQLPLGSTIKVITEEGDFEGVFKSITDGTDGKEIQLLNCNHMGKMLPGIQSFALSDIEQILPESKASNDDVTKIESDGNRLLNGSNVPKPKSKPRVKDRPVICKVRKKNIADISHLNNLHLLRLPELLDQVQIEDPLHLHASEKVPGAFTSPSIVNFELILETLTTGLVS